MFTTFSCFAVQIRAVPTLGNGNFVAMNFNMPAGTWNGLGSPLSPGANESTVPPSSNGLTKSYCIRHGPWGGEDKVGLQLPVPMLLSGMLSLSGKTCWAKTSS